MDAVCFLYPDYPTPDILLDFGKGLKTSKRILGLAQMATDVGVRALDVWGYSEKLKESARRGELTQDQVRGLQWLKIIEQGYGLLDYVPFGPPVLLTLGGGQGLRQSGLAENVETIVRYNNRLLRAIDDPSYLESDELYSRIR